MEFVNEPQPLGVCGLLRSGEHNFGVKIFRAFGFVLKKVGYVAISNDLIHEICCA